MKNRLDRNRLGEVLVHNGAITTTQLRFALAQQRVSSVPLGRFLVEQHMIRRGDLYRALAQQFTFRVMMTAMTLTISMSAFGAKTARAGEMRDIPAGVSLVNSANSAFTPVNYYPALFGSQERESTNLKPFIKWTSMFDHFERDMRTEKGQRVMAKLQRDLQPDQGLPLREMAERVNDLLNKVAYVEDKDNYGVSDYWADPVEFLTRGGDCEDFAIAKYVALRALGVPESRMRVAIVQDLQKGVPHAILVLYTDDGAMLLDNQAATVRAANDVSRYRPIFSINREGWWLHTKPQNTQMVALQTVSTDPGAGD